MKVADLQKMPKEVMTVGRDKQEIIQFERFCFAVLIGKRPIK